MRAAVIENGEVTNVILVDDLGVKASLTDAGLIQGDLVECSDEVGIGFTYDGSTFVAPLPDKMAPQGA